MGGTPLPGKPLGGFPPNPLSLVLTEGVRGSHRVASVMPKGEAFRHQGKDTANKLVDQRLAARSEGYKATEGLSLSASWESLGGSSFPPQLGPEIGGSAVVYRVAAP